VRPSPDYQHGDEGILDAGRAVVQSVDQVTLLSPACLLNWTALPSPLLPYLSSRPYLTTILCLLAVVYAPQRRTPLLRQHTALSFGIPVLSRATSPMHPQSWTFARTLRCPASRVCANWSMRSYPALTTCFSTVPHPECVAQSRSAHSCT
jgi:hypothetical protein